MLQVRALVTGMLLMVSVIQIISTPIVNTQSFTTITSLHTVTSQSTATSTIVSAIGTSSVILTSTNTLFDETFTFQPAKGFGYCYWYHFRYEATANQRIQGTVQSSGPVTFYVLTDAAYQEWRGTGGCAPFGHVLSSPLTASYSIDWTVPRDDTYQFVILWSSKPNENAVVFHAWSTDVGAPLALDIYTTMTQIVATTVTLTSKSAYAQEIAQAFSLGQYEMLIVIAAAIVLAAVLALRLRSRKLQGVSLTEQTAGFCMNCGAPLVAGKKYCNKCGKPVETAVA